MLHTPSIMTDNVRYHFLLCHYFHARVVSECEYGLLSTKNSLTHVAGFWVEYCYEALGPGQL